MSIVAIGAGISLAIGLYERLSGLIAKAREEKRDLTDEELASVGLKRSQAESALDAELARRQELDAKK